MPKKGDQAREAVKNTIIEAFNATNNFVAFVDKKIYVTAQDGPGGEVLQFAISLTMPKTPVANIPQLSATDWRDDKSEVVMQATPPAPVEISPSDKEQVERLKILLGITKS